MTAAKLYRKINNIIAIDAGTTKSGWVRVTDDKDLKPIEYGFWQNEELEYLIQDTNNEIYHPYKLTVVLEDIQSYGMPVGIDVFETVKWLGELRHYCKSELIDYVFIKRSEVKNFLCKSNRASDKNVRQALIDYYGGNEKAIGGKKCVDCKGKGYTTRQRIKCVECEGSGYFTEKGVLHGISGHVWSALGVAVTHYNLMRVKEATKLLQAARK
tara:strand:+ start:639 stop:1277 length:639 start_codon:yes stop_codon:yes gene_type:complete